MLVRICGPEGSTDPPEWALIELQGKIEYADEEQEQLLDKIKDIGMLNSDGSKVYITIGYHQLEGKRVPLKKPFAILQQVNKDDTTAQITEDEPATQYEVQGVIRSKFLFNTRPTALISKPVTRSQR